MFSFAEYKARKELTKQIPRLRRYSHVLCYGAEDADDLVQATLERALSRIGQWQQGTDMRAWLFTIMHNVSINLQRLQHREQAMMSEDDPDLIPASSRLNDHDSLVSEIEIGLRQLPEKHREVLMLVGMEQLSYQHTAEVLGVPLGTVMSRLNRARRQLRKIVFDNQKPSLRRVK